MKVAIKDLTEGHWCTHVVLVPDTSLHRSSEPWLAGGNVEGVGDVRDDWQLHLLLFQTLKEIFLKKKTRNKT